MTENDQAIDIAIIVAMAENRVIGVGNQLPWHLPADLQYFKATTMGKPIVMGRKTFESIGRPLPGRTNIVVTTNADFAADGVIVAGSVEQALAIARSVALRDKVGEVMVIRGAQLYAACLPLVNRLYVTQIHAQIEGDAWFPELNWRQWDEQKNKDFPADSASSYRYSFVVYGRNSDGGE